MSSHPLLWPLRGCAYLVRHPRLLLGTVATMSVVLVGLALSCGWVVHATWPPPGLALWSTIWRAGRALVLGATTGIALWVSIVPLVMSLAVEDLARQIHRAQGTRLAPEPSFGGALRASLVVLRATIGLRLTVVAVCLGSTVLGPAGVVVCALMLGVVACSDALDTALAARNCPGRERLRLLAAHRRTVAGGACTAGLLTVALGVTVVGWWLWLPALVAGAALEVHDWPMAGVVAGPDTLDPA